MRLTFLFCFCAFYGLNQIPKVRQVQLDSVVSNLNKQTLRNLDSVHYKLHLAGENDEERVFLYFGLIAIHYKYDLKRKGDKSAKEYSEYYIANKKSGVCRDFALLFNELCERSEIPCVMASGRVKVPAKEGFKDLFKRRIYRVNHAWNVVKFNDTWHPVDPTWSKIDSVRKYYVYDATGRRKYAGKVKISNRAYYDKTPKDFYRKRTCVHPAFYCMDTVYTYRTSKRKYKNRKIYATNYDYTSVLDSLSSNRDYELKSAYQTPLSAYSNLKLIYSSLSREFIFTEIKRTKFDKLTALECDLHLVDLERRLAIVKAELGVDFSLKMAEHKRVVQKLKQKLERTQKPLVIE